MGQPQPVEVKRRRGLLAVLLALGQLSLSVEAQAGSSKEKGGTVSSDAALLERIRAVDPVHAETMARQPTDFTAEPLPFYRKFKLVRATVELPHRPLELRYADSGAETVHLTGRPADVYRVNDAEGLALAQEQVPAYVRFFVANTAAGDDQRAVVERAEDVDWLPDTETDPALRDARARASSHIQSMAVSAVAGGYRVTASVVEGTKLLELKLKVDARGRVDVESSKVLVPDLPVPETL